jgi:hypothetical protein
MKTLLSFLLITAISITSFSQSNKPEKGFGLGYGINFFNTPSHSVRFTHWTKKNIEYGGEITFNYSNSKNVNVDSTIIFTLDGFNAVIPLTTTRIDSRYSVGINPIVLYHFPTKNNLDLFIGGILPIGLNNSSGNNSVERVVDVPNYYVSELQKQTLPLNVNIGLQFTAGTNYFFYNNLAIGASFRLGYFGSFSNGKTINTISSNSSGSNNPFTYSQTTINESNNINTFTNIGFNGSALFTLSYYFSRDKEGKTKD